MTYISGKWYTAAADDKNNNKNNNKNNKNNKSKKQKLTRKPNLELTSGYCFLPYPNKFGAADLLITGGIYDSKEKTYLPGSTEIRIRANILNKNDRPKISKSTFVLPNPLPYNYSDIAETGTEVKDILIGKTVSDADGDDIGELLNLY